MLKRTGDAQPILCCNVLPAPFHSSDVGRVGGNAIGVSADGWPLAEDGQAMTHVMTIDLDAHVLLRSRMGAGDEVRAMALFVRNPAWHFTVHSPEHRWLALTEAEIEQGEAPSLAPPLPRRQLRWWAYDVPRHCLQTPAAHWTLDALKVAQQLSKLEGFIGADAQLRFRPRSVGFGYHLPAWLVADLSNESTDIDALRIDRGRKDPVDALLAETGTEFEGHAPWSDFIRGTFSPLEQLLTRMCRLCEPHFALGFVWGPDHIRFDLDGEVFDVALPDSDERVIRWVDAAVFELNTALLSCGRNWRFAALKRLQLLPGPWIAELADHPALADAELDVEELELTSEETWPDALPTTPPLHSLLPADQVFDEGISYVSLVAGHVQRMAQHFGMHTLSAEPRKFSPSEDGKMHLSMSGDHVSWTARLTGASHASRRSLLRELNRFRDETRTLYEVRLDVYDTAIVFVDEEDANVLRQHGYLVEDWRLDWADDRFGAAGVEVARFSGRSALPRLAKQMRQLMSDMPLEAATDGGGYSITLGDRKTTVRFADREELRPASMRVCRAINKLMHQAEHGQRWVVYRGDYDYRMVPVSNAWAATLREFFPSVADSLEPDFHHDGPSLLPIAYPSPVLEAEALTPLEDIVPRKRILYTDFKCSARATDFPELLKEIATFANVDVVVEPVATPDAKQYSYTVLASHQGVHAKVIVENRKYADATPMFDYLNALLAAMNSKRRLLGQRWRRCLRGCRRGRRTPSVSVCRSFSRVKGHGLWGRPPGGDSRSPRRDLSDRRLSPPPPRSQAFASNPVMARPLR